MTDDTCGKLGKMFEIALELGRTRVGAWTLMRPARTPDGFAYTLALPQAFDRDCARLEATGNGRTIVVWLGNVEEQAVSDDDAAVMLADLELILDGVRAERRAIETEGWAPLAAGLVGTA